MTLSTAAPHQTSMTWLLFAVMTFCCWGLYGVFLHKGQVQMADPVNGRYKAYLFVGIAYFLVAVLAPLAILLLKGASWQYPTGGVAWSLIAGTVGAFGAFGVLLAFGAAPRPTYVYVPVVMSIIFAGAPMVNAAVSTTIEGNWGNIRWQFLAGIVLAALGATLVVLYKPAPPATPAAESPAAASAPASPPAGHGEAPARPEDSPS